MQKTWYAHKMYISYSYISFAIRHEKDDQVNERKSKTTSVHICSFERCKRTWHFDEYHCFLTNTISTSIPTFSLHFSLSDDSGTVTEARLENHFLSTDCSILELSISSLRNERIRISVEYTFIVWELNFNTTFLERAYKNEILRYNILN